MKWKFMARTVAFITALLGEKELPIDGEKKALNLSAEQYQKIEAALGKKMADEAINGIDQEIKNMATNNLELKAIQDEIDALVAETNLSPEEIEKIAKDKKGDKSILATVQNLVAKQKEQSEMIAKLIQQPEGDNPLAIIKGGSMQKVTHSATHLFGSASAIDAFDGRNWNRRAAGLATSATDFTSQPNIDKLNNDMDLYSP
ncbi:hypothetical protein [Flavobacterium nitratireducens]|uniref:hypothetical protein n=1 Tax=Flavobacterium nitratireducens TaxID=992289 RepID=UPI0024154150|nr:hypothetical protein [Flavobacterium nitratireducens]